LPPPRPPGRSPHHNLPCHVFLHHIRCCPSSSTTATVRRRARTRSRMGRSKPPTDADGYFSGNDDPRLGGSGDIVDRGRLNWNSGFSSGSEGPIRSPNTHP
jgi:hypothetical protein